ncbi:hypothetical protein C2E23DRAFT_417189 [Lenzites betulinus]|nr:hypothetical protein C2E23DRAFT_417189 [Lenzites betulinus]
MAVALRLCASSSCFRANSIDECSGISRTVRLQGFQPLSVSVVHYSMEMRCVIPLQTLEPDARILTFEVKSLPVLFTPFHFGIHDSLVLLPPFDCTAERVLGQSPHASRAWVTSDLSTKLLGLCRCELVSEVEPLMLEAVFLANPRVIPRPWPCTGRLVVHRSTMTATFPVPIRHVYTSTPRNGPRSSMMHFKQRETGPHSTMFIRARFCPLAEVKRLIIC